jgi:hypothetical protein
MDAAARHPYQFGTERSLGRPGVNCGCPWGIHCDETFGFWVKVGGFDGHPLRRPSLFVEIHRLTPFPSFRLPRAICQFESVASHESLLFDRTEYHPDGNRIE